ncbi:TPA: response regulator transcription factor [Pseudomonas putida]
MIIEVGSYTSNLMTECLSREGFEAVRAQGRLEGLVMIRKLEPVLILLNNTVATASGNLLLIEIRQMCNTPVVVLAPCAADSEKIGALRLGADDYIPIPCNPRELMARIQATLRRVSPRDALHSTLECDDIWVNVEALVAGVRNDDGDSTLLKLTRTELFLLTALLRSPCKVFTRDELHELSMPGSNAYSRVIDTHMCNLRRKLEVAGAKRTPVTVRAVGYRFKSTQMH